MAIHYGNDPFEPTDEDFKAYRKTKEYQQFCQTYNKSYHLFTVGKFTLWGFLSVTVLVLGGLIIFFNR